MFGRCVKPLALLLMWGAMTFVVTGTARAQQPAGSLQGKVFDPSGAAIPRAKVQIRKGVEFLVDGFRGGRLPPKDAIQEILINQNPFSAKYSQIGFGRIEILTKAGSRTVHGTLSLKGSDAALNSRNPFTAVKPGYHAEDLTGLLSHRTS